MPAKACKQSEAAATTSTVMPSTPRATWLTICAVVAAVWATPAAAIAEKTAVLPTSGSADTDTRARLDVAIRKALAKEKVLVTLQSAKDTGTHVSSMAELGVVCDNDDIPCLQKLGIVAGVSRLLVVEASGKRTLEVKVTSINVDEGSVLRTTSATISLSEAGDINDLVQRVLKGEPTVPGILDTTDDPAATKPASALDEPTPVVVSAGSDETEPGGLRFAGAVTAGIGGGIGVIGLLGALSCEALYWTGTGPAATRRDVIAPLGAVMWVVSGVGVVAAGIGGALFFAGAPASTTQTKLDAE